MDAASATPDPRLEITDARETKVGAGRVRRALPHRPRRTVGAWCFVDHMGPETVDSPERVGIGPHPHIGLQTVTWLLAGRLRHLDTLGSDQVIEPGQLNLMTAGHGVAHAEEATDYRGEFEGMQLWVAQPDATRHEAPAFEHHGDLPRFEVGNGEATVLVGSSGTFTSPARRDTDHVGIDLDLRRGTSSIELDPTFEYAVVVARGAVVIDDERVEPGQLAYLGGRRRELDLTGDEASRLLLLGGVPFETEPTMWWNFVGRSHDEIDAAAQSWNAADDRFGAVRSRLGRIPAPDRPWR